MSLKLTNRLDQIENDIRLMLTLQKCENITRSSQSIRSNVDMNSKSLILQKISCGCDKFDQLSEKSEKSSKSLPASFDKGVFLGDKDVIQPPPEFASAPSSSLVEDIYQKKNNSSFRLELEYEQTRRRILEDKVIKLKEELSSTSQSKEIAFNMSNSLKEENEKLKLELKEMNCKLSDLWKEKDFLCKCLEREKELRNNEKINQINKSWDINMSDENSDEKLENKEEENEENKSLKDSIEILSKQLEEKKEEIQNLLTHKEKFVFRLKRQKEVSKKLSEINQKLSNSIKIKHENFMVLKNKSNKCEKELEEFKEKFDTSQKEIEALKQQLDDERMLNNKIPEDYLEKMRILRDKEQLALEMIKNLNEKIKKMEENSNLNESQKEVVCWKVENENLRVKVNELSLKVENCRENENKIIKLQQYVDEQKRKIDELEYIRQHQEVVINTQNEQLLSKEEQIRLQEQENEIVREKCLQLDKELENTRNILESKQTFEENHAFNWEKICELENKIEELRSTLENQKQNLFTKDERTTEVETMKKLAAALETSKEKLEMTIRELDREKESSKIMENGLEKLNMRKEKLEGMMIDLEGSCNGLLLEKDHYFKLCKELEKELEEEKMLRLQEKQILVDEKNKAFEVARMAAVTLIETVEDYEDVAKVQMELKQSISNIVKSNQQKRRPYCPHSIQQMEKSQDTSYISPDTSSISLKDDQKEEILDQITTSKSSNIKPKINKQYCFSNGIVESDGVMGIQIPVTALNPYAVQSGLIPTTTHACWLRNCDYQPNKGLYKDGNPYKLAATRQCQCGSSCNVLQRKASKYRPSLKVITKKSSTTFKKRSR